MSTEGRKTALIAKHAALDHRIEMMIGQPYYSDLDLAGLKKEKLAVKDELTRMERGEAEREEA